MRQFEMEKLTPQAGKTRHAYSSKRQIHHPEPPKPWMAGKKTIHAGMTCESNLLHAVELKPELLEPSHERCTASPRIPLGPERTRRWMCGD